MVHVMSNQELTLIAFVIGMLLIGATVAIDFATRKPRNNMLGEALPLDLVDLEGLLALQHATSPKPETGTWRNVWIRVPTQDDPVDPFLMSDNEYRDPSSIGGDE